MKPRTWIVLTDAASGIGKGFRTALNASAAVSWQAPVVERVFRLWHLPHPRSTSVVVRLIGANRSFYSLNPRYAGNAAKFRGRMHALATQTVT